MMAKVLNEYNFLIGFIDCIVCMGINVDILRAQLHLPNLQLHIHKTQFH